MANEMGIDGAMPDPPPRKQRKKKDLNPEPMTLDRAVDIVARRVLYDSDVDEGLLWENYPEIGEHDLARITARIVELTPEPDDALYAAAYDFLAWRALTAEPDSQLSGQGDDHGK